MSPFDDERLFTWFYRTRSQFELWRLLVWRVLGTKVEGVKLEDDGTEVEVEAFEFRGVRLIWRLKVDGHEVKT